jgi:O-antigen/teichoic acid export membrane protein
MNVLPARTMWVGAAQITGQLAAVVTAVLLARRLGVEGFGIYAFATVTIFVVNVVTTFGTDLVLIRDVARDGRLDHCVAALGLRCCCRRSSAWHGRRCGAWGCCARTPAWCWRPLSRHSQPLRRSPGTTLGVSLFVGPNASGWYSGASRIVEGSKVGHVALATASYPLMVQEHTDADAAVAVAVRRSWTACLVLGASVSIVLLVAGPTMVSWLYGDGYAPSGRGLRILALGVIPSTVATFHALSMLAEHREREVLQTMAIKTFMARTRPARVMGMMS